jgi:uncharacterized protein (DUF2249 family)
MSACFSRVTSTRPSSVPFDNLDKGQAIVIVNDHDPRPLHRQFITTRPDTFDWTYETEGPEVWRVRIARR